MWGYFRMPHFQKKYGLPKGLFRVHRSHRIHVWYIFLDLPQIFNHPYVGKYNIYIWILFSGGKVTRKFYQLQVARMIFLGRSPCCCTASWFCHSVGLMVVCGCLSAFFLVEKMIVVFTTHTYHIYIYFFRIRNAPQKSNMDSQKLSFWKGVTFSKAHHFGHPAVSFQGGYIYSLWAYFHVDVRCGWAVHETI